jgi:hypothetical protein
MSIESTESNVEVIELVPTENGFSERELKRARKAMKKAGIPKPWIISLQDRETKETIKFKL